MIQAATTCRSCGAGALTPVLDLGVTPLANRLLEAHELNAAEPRYPLRVAFCRSCALVQLTDTVPSEQLFRDGLCRPSFCDAVVDNWRRRGERGPAEKLVAPGRGLVIELASNDGYLLQHYRRAGVAVLGIEPAGNIARIARQRHGIETVNDFFTADLATRLAIHGGSLRLWVMHAEAATRGRAVDAMLDDEARQGMRDAAYYQRFSQRVAALGDEVRAMLGRLRAAGKRIAVYGASAKGSTLQNYLGIGRETVEFVADRSTVKQGRFTPGTHLPIVAAEALTERMPDYTLLLSWNFRDEILAQQQTYRQRGGRFIVPIPKVEVV